ncbi:response regulator [Niveispirillum fermenti]|uniref:response regulator n=1 Tax=Niveispirillum fermenti TaxID=1233113 RepID=UPI003A8AB50B
MPDAIHILHLEDSPLDCELVGAHLRKAGLECEITRVETREAFTDALGTTRFDLVLADFVLPGFDGLSALQIAQDRAPDTPFIFLSGKMGEELAVEALRHGARDYVLKERLVRLAAAVNRAIDEARILVERQQAEAKFRALAESMPQLVWSAQPQGAVDYLNGNWHDYTGAENGENIGDGWLAVLHPDDRRRTQDRWSTAVATGEEYEIEYRLRRHDGVFRWFLGRALPLYDKDGQIIRWFGTCTDIDDAIKFRTALSESREELERLVDARTGELISANAKLRAEVAERKRAQADLSALYAKTPVPLHSLDSEGRLLSVSDRWLEFMGYDDRSQVIGRHITEFMPPDYARLHLQSRWPELMREGVVRDLPYQIIKRSGEVADILVSARIDRDEQGRFLRTMDAIVDVTARLRAEAERERAEEALRHAQKMDALGQLTGGIAHDFNNLLTAITGNLELLNARIDGDDRDGLRAHTTNAKAAAARAAALTQRLLAFARRQPLRPDETEPGTLIRGMEELLGRTVGEQVSIRTEAPPGIWPAWCDANQLEIALLNLVVNARDAMPDGGRITITAANARLTEAELTHGGQPGDYVRLSVSDTGSGMAPDIIARAFDPFFTTKPIGQGTGLGLSQVYGFVSQSNGVVRIESLPGRGTTVHLFLPRSEKGRLEQAGEPVVAATIEARNATSGTVLIVEDEVLVRMVAVQALQDAGLQVVEASDGAQALALLDDGLRLDLLVSDVGLPGMNGRQLAEAARERRPGLGVLFMTGYAFDVTLGTGILEPGCQVLQKPFETRILVTRVREMLSGPGGAAGPDFPAPENSPAKRHYA